MIDVYSIFSSIQGESTFAGHKCTFIRLFRCPLNCSYCDTRYASGDVDNVDFKSYSVFEIVKKVISTGNNLICVTGGEPLFQNDCLLLLEKLIDNEFTVILETSGAFPLDKVSKRTHIVLDAKCPDSGENSKIITKNYDFLSKRDEIKFVLSSKNDFDWAISHINHFNLSKKAKLLFSPVHGRLNPKDLWNWIVSTNLPVQLNLQLHKHVWPEDIIDK